MSYEKVFHIGLLAAMPEELGGILDNLRNVEVRKYGDLELFSGEWLISKNKSIFITTAWSGWGKVSAARATTRLISSVYKNKKIDFASFTGLAGAANISLKQWDVVVAESLMQHDMDATPIFEKFFIPPIKKKKILVKPNLVEFFFRNLVQKSNMELKEFGSINKGLVATGDSFISDKDKLECLKIEIPNLLAVEMEGASFAQVCQQEKLECIVVRVISDNANDDAQEEFSDFLLNYKNNSIRLIKTLINVIHEYLNKI